MPDPLLMATAAAVAAVVAAGVAWLANYLRYSGGAAGVGLGLFAGAWILGLFPKLPPTDALGRCLLLLIPIAIVAEVAVVSRAAWAWRLVAAALVAPTLLYGSGYVTDLAGPGSREWPLPLTLAVYAGSAVVLFGAWTALHWLATSVSQSAETPPEATPFSDNRTVPMALAISAGGAALTVMLSGYATGGQLGLPLATAIGVFTLLGGRHLPGAIGVAVVALFGLLVIGHLFASLSMPNAALLFAAPLLAGLPTCLPSRWLGPKGKAAVSIALTATLVGVVLFFAQQKFAIEASEASPPGQEASFSDYLE